MPVWIRTIVFTSLAACWGLTTWALFSQHDRLKSAIQPEIKKIRSNIFDMATTLNVMVGTVESRRAIIMRDVRTLSGSRYILLLGDSITENFYPPESVCGVRVVNAGIGSERASSFIPFAEDISLLPKPTVTVVALGMNDAQEKYWTEDKSAQFHMMYGALLSLLPADTIMASLTPFDPTKEVGRTISREAWTMVNSTIMETAARRNATLVDLSKIDIASNSVDGVHLTEFGYPAWWTRLLGPIKARLGC